MNLGYVNNVTSNLKLPSVGEKDTQITWESSDTKVIALDGTVTRPEAGTGDKIVTLKAKITKGKVSDEKTFLVTVKAKEFTNEELLNKAFEALNLGDTTSVIENIVLSTKGENDTTIAWKSSNTSVVSNDGKVTRPEAGNPDGKATLTATITKGGVSKNKNFDVIVKAKVKTVDQILDLAKGSLNLGSLDLNNVISNITLPLKGAEDVAISWKSNNTAVLSNDGKVTRPEVGKSDANVTLTATITKDGKSTTKDFNLTVKAKSELEVNSKEEFYNVLKNALENFEDKVVVKVKNYNDVDYDLAILEKVVTEHPEIDYGYEKVDGNISGYRESSEKTVTASIGYRLSKEEMIRQKGAVQAKTREVISSIIKSGMTAVQKELAIHNYIIEHGRYDVEHVNDNPVLPEDHNAYGILIDGVGVCESYAKAMYELCKAAGVECRYVTGTGNGGGHAWNMVKLDDGQWYNVDVTWDDPTYADPSQKMFEVQYNYFNLTDANFKNHTRNALTTYPVATGTQYAFENLNVEERDIEGNIYSNVKTTAELDAKIKEAIEKKATVLTLKVYDIGMDINALSNEVETVIKKGNINTNDIKSWRIGGTGSSVKYIKYSFQY